MTPACYGVHEQSATVEKQMGASMSSELTVSVGYQSYLLRLWPVRSDGIVVWRASLENTHTDEQHGFGTLEQLVTFLREHITTANCSGSSGTWTRSMGADFLGDGTRIDPDGRLHCEIADQPELRSSGSPGARWS